MNHAFSVNIVTSTSECATSTRSWANERDLTTKHVFSWVGDAHQNSVDESVC